MVPLDKPIRTFLTLAVRFVAQPQIASDWTALTTRVGADLDGTFSVFVSHSEKDGQYLEAIRGALRGSGVRPYIAEENATPGARLSGKIRSKIEECDVFLLVLTENSASSSFVNREIGYAIGLEKFVLPVVIGGRCPQNLCSDIEYIRLDLTNPGPSVRAIRSLIKQRKAEAELSDLVKVGAIALGAVAWAKYGPQVKERLALWWQNLNRPPQR